MKLTIKKCNQQLIASIAEALGTDNSDALNFLLLTLKSQGYSIGSTVTNISAIQPTAQPTTTTAQPITSQIGFEYTNQFDTIQNSSELIEEIDPIIARLVSLGVCHEF